MQQPVLLELDGITKRYGGVTIADRLSLKVEAGEAVGVVGPNGAGKTSLFGIIAGDIAPDAGRVLVDGTVVTKLSSADRCRLGIGRTYQVPRPFERMSVFENVLVAAQQGGGLRRGDSYARAEGVLQSTGLHRVANQPAGKLGLLQRKRLELARALATGPRLLLLDEVAGGLTDPEVAELVGIVRSAREGGAAVVWIEHVVRALVTTVGRLVCLAGGRVLGDGVPADVLAMADVREVFLGTDPETGDGAAVPSLATMDAGAPGSAT